MILWTLHCRVIEIVGFKLTVSDFELELELELDHDTARCLLDL